jgi:hypothetical protein
MVPSRILNLLQTNLKKLVYLLMKPDLMQWERGRATHAFHIDAEESAEQQLGRNYHP